MAQNAFGKINMKLLDSNNESFTEQPGYINFNLLQDDTTTADAMNASLNNALWRVVNELTYNSYTEGSVTYEVSLHD